MSNYRASPHVLSASGCRGGLSGFIAPDENVQARGHHRGSHMAVSRGYSTCPPHTWLLSSEKLLQKSVKSWIGTKQQLPLSPFLNTTIHFPLPGYKVQSVLLCFADLTLSLPPPRLSPLMLRGSPLWSATHNKSNGRLWSTMEIRNHPTPRQMITAIRLVYKFQKLANWKERRRRWNEGSPPACCLQPRARVGIV